MPIDGSIHPAPPVRAVKSFGVQRAPLPGPTPVEPAAPLPPASEGAAPNQPADEIDVQREAAREAAAEQRVRAQERTARTKERDRELREREARVVQFERRVGAWRGNPRLAIQDMAQAGVSFDDLARAFPNGIPASDPNDQVRAELDDLRNGIPSDREQDRAEQARAQRAAEASARDEYLRDLAVSAKSSPESYPMILHFGDRVAGYLFQTAEEMFNRTGRAPRESDVLDAVERNLRAEIESGTSGLGGRPAALRPTPGRSPNPVPARPAENAAGSRRAFSTASGTS